jgi:predicted nucleic acid-binding protein
MRRVVIDTNIYVDWINRRKHEDVVFQRETVKYLSAVVLMELRAGALSRRDLRFLRGLQASFELAARLLVPSLAVFAEAGDAMRSLRASGHRIGASHSIANDVLSAMSARSIGATVVTRNERDYRAIQSIRPFRLTIASGD